MIELIKKIVGSKPDGESWVAYSARLHRIWQVRNLQNRPKVGKEELAAVKQVMKSGNLFHGVRVKQFRQECADLLGAKNAITSTSGTAAIHVAVAMINPDPGDEIIVPPITDMGTIIPVLYQNAIPVFADVDPTTWNIDPKSIEKVITARTKAIIAVHLLGNPCAMDEILAIAHKHNLVVIEDCAQAHLTQYKGKYVGTVGDIGCFSFQHSKHMTTGEGGMTITNHDEYAARGRYFVDKGWDRTVIGPRKYTMLGMNYRMTELQAAVGIAQLGKLQALTQERTRNGELLSELIKDIAGVHTQHVESCSASTYWLYGLSVDPDAPFTADALARGLEEERVYASPHYIGEPIFMCHDGLIKGKIYGNSSFPFDLHGKDIKYKKGVCPVAEDILRRCVMVQLQDGLSEGHIKDMAHAIAKVVNRLTKNFNRSKTHMNLEGKFKVGLVGCGTIAREHLTAYQEHPSAAVVAIADIDGEALKSVAAEFGVPGRYQDYQEMLASEELDIVSICTWPGQHAEMTRVAAVNGVKAILCEKPIALNLGEADEMIATCRENDVRLVIGHQHRFNPHVNRAKNLIATGALGEVELIWGHFKGSLLNNGTHVVDTIRYLLGDPETDWVIGQIERKNDSYDRGHAVEEVAAGLVQFTGGTRALIEMGNLAKQDFEFHVVGENGQLRLSHKYLVKNVKKGGWKRIEEDPSRSCYGQIDELIRSLNGEINHRGDAGLARETLAILMAVFESVRSNGVVKPPFSFQQSPLDMMVENGNSANGHLSKLISEKSKGGRAT